MGFLPVTAEEMHNLGWKRPDFVYVSGDAYVDHSSFGMAIITRVLESRGYKVAVIAQPDWRDAESIAVFGEPRLGFLVSAGNMDSMVNHYTVNKKRRSSDAYSPGGQTGKRPDYATIVYCNLIKRKYKKVPVLIGGIEASLRRLAHYDYWQNKLKRSILLDSGADILLYGMGELAVVQVAEALDSGLPPEEITYVPGTVVKRRDLSGLPEVIRLPDYAELEKDRRKYAESFRIQYRNTDSVTARPLAEKYGENRYVVQNPPSRPLTMQEMDDVYGLPYMNTWHPSYEKEGGVPAIAEVKFSLTSNRGCFGGCSFCALAFHQGRAVQVRSHESLIKEAEAFVRDPAFKGYIHDVGGPTADFRRTACEKQKKYGVCTDRQCLFPKPCKNLVADHEDYVSLLRKLRALPGVKKVFVRSGIRFDYVLADKKDTFLKELCRYHISGQLRVAPEHVTDRVLALMGKPENKVYREFAERFEQINRSLKKEQYLVPYLISSHPGSTLEDAVALAESVRDMGYMPEQVQDFYPTPSTISTVMYYTGLDPRNMQPVYTATNPHEKAMQRALIQFRKPENYDLVKEALLKCGRSDLIGFDHKTCLIPPRKPKEEKINSASGKNRNEQKTAKGGSTGRKGKDSRTGQKGSSAGRTGQKRSAAGKGGSTAKKAGKGGR